MLMYKMMDECTGEGEKKGMKINEDQTIKFKMKYHGQLGIDYRVFDYVNFKNIAKIVDKCQTRDSFEIAGNFTDIGKLNK